MTAKEAVQFILSEAEKRRDGQAFPLHDPTGFVGAIIRRPNASSFTVSVSKGAAPNILHFKRYQDGESTSCIVTADEAIRAVRWLVLDDEPLPLTGRMTVKAYNVAVWHLWKSRAKRDGVVVALMPMTTEKDP